MKKIYNEDTYYIAWNDSKIHTALAKAGTQVATIMPNYEEFDNEDNWKNRLKELGYDLSKFDEEVIQE